MTCRPVGPLRRGIVGGDRGIRRRRTTALIPSLPSQPPLLQLIDLIGNGLPGVAVGFGLGNIVTLFTDFAVSVPMNWAVIGVTFCTIVGLTFGLWPAVKASKLAPIDALSYE